MIIVVRHYGCPFVDSEHARLLATGMFNHIIWLVM